MDAGSVLTAYVVFCAIWAFTKGTSNLAGSGPTSLLPGAETVNGNNLNKRKQIWTTEKSRQQTKENKTKKLFAEQFADFTGLIEFISEALELSILLTSVLRK